jgi:flagellar biosynthesis/type III secretory pathway ATPase
MYPARNRRRIKLLKLRINSLDNLLWAGAEGQRKGIIADKGENQSNLMSNGNKVKQTLSNQVSSHFNPQCRQPCNK